MNVHVMYKGYVGFSWAMFTYINRNCAGAVCRCGFCLLNNLTTNYLGVILVSFRSDASVFLLTFCCQCTL